MENNLHEKYMKIAIKEAEENLEKPDGGPFGACIVKNDKVISVARNMVLSSDATAHAEVNAIRLASEKLGKYNLSGCTIYSTTEPCPMCFSAIHWAKIDKVFFGTNIGDVKRLGFNELTIPVFAMKKMGKSKVKLHGNLLLVECRELLNKWKGLKKRVVY
ncbi:MAG: nucleoside deaminase [PVC group bacterium]|nr:nucleoside deaminase [PVC group bacterium]